MNPDEALLNAMAAHGLNPGTIVWSKKIERFNSQGETGRKKSGWYVAHPDNPPSAHFGCWKLGVDETWTLKGNGQTDEYDPEKWAEVQREREREREKEWDKAAEKAQARWDAADLATPEHPYLKKKGVTDVTRIKQEKSTLLIPMRSFDRGNPIVSLQEVNVKGEKKFMKGGRAAGTRLTIGAGSFKSNDTLYVTEGFATGQSIHEVTGQAVVVAFSSNNLAYVTQKMREREPLAMIIVAADNDRWSTSVKGPNPGVIAAQEAAMASNTLFAIPDFQDLSTKPTDFNDLFLLEGEEAVKKWLDPAVAHHAATTPEGVVAELPPPSSPDDGPVLEPDSSPDEEATSWTDKAKFRCLGFNRGTYFYFPEEQGQIVPLSTTAHQKNQLMSLAPLSWWEQYFPGKKEANWTAGADAMMRVSHRQGVFSQERIRGRGCWPEEDDEGNKGIVLHLGDRLLSPGAKKFVKPDKYISPEGSFYERGERLKGPSEKHALTLEETQQVLDLFRDLLWHDDASAYLAAGWTALAPLGGVLPWRPHIWLTGGSGAGKSTVQAKLIQPLLGGMKHYFEGGSTEAGIRQRLGTDSLAVLYDEAEKQDTRTEKRIQSVLGLARGASSTDTEAETAKGTPSGQAFSFQIRSMFCLASVGGAIKSEADKTRISLLQMKSRASMDPAEKLAHWRKYEPRLLWVNSDRGRELVARTLGWLRDGRLAETLQVFREAASAVLSDARFGDQYGTLYAGAWTLMADEVPDMIEAKELMGGEDLSQYVEDQAPEGIKAMQTLLQQHERVETNNNGPKTMAVGQLVGIVAGQTNTEVSYDEADKKLKQLGLRVDTIEGQYYIYVANSSRWVKESLKDTPYYEIQSALRTLKEAIKTDNAVRFHTGMVSRCIAVPLSLLD